ncbi:hypothetical protein KL918_004116 [Ogataea parapolymorpha]|uniref:Threonylcarbamoyl-AMP synthase n=1 Tax=Ogataea parapolymorpha (strain ATCC 26012 / BCRC 20466 / JCM 22074 / NRRL Y-7560 / DL-1) TaxID=871575 RepID=W1QC24_OGAPD|nr:tRNA threonylcarbamoyladenosine biosynthesis protein SUA5 [Ogataea parapolymorpha DL-1]ESW98140.1 tRNA threonylcarbamoyladenosine biosynthesis protein SUA5 [Ogataea parapolymorpha DL-1]KAG7866127.1 hypothetical protein KL918_004116 [Ogataea parapolymorpha]KAG7874718.1 hypothetical protein KL916_000962 [Ogataea parapolymorpha]
MSSTLETKILPVKPESISFENAGTTLTITDPETKQNLEYAADILRNTHHAVGFPSETVYGLGASSLSSESVKSIYAAKNRPADNPLISHVSSIDQLKRKLMVPGQEIPEIYAPLIEKFWPGPLTILLPMPENVHDSPISQLVTSGQPTFAVRMPQNPVARALIYISDLPLAAPSANASTRPSPTTAAHVYHDLKGRIPLILDGGPSDVGLESTVVDGLCDPPMLLRPGGISLEQIKQAGGPRWQNIVVAKKTAGKLEPVRTPGMKYRHYSPTARVVLFNNCGDGKEKVKAYLEQNNLQNKKVALLKTRRFAPANDISPLISYDGTLGTSGDEIQRNLFSALRALDAEEYDYILIEGVDETAEGLAIMNRLSKAASETING